MSSPTGFVEWGFYRVRAALRPVLRERIAAEYAERLAKANSLQRLALHWQMRAELKRRLEQQAPSCGCY
jgi:hypothetical protein